MFRIFMLVALLLSGCASDAARSARECMACSEKIRHAALLDEEAALQLLMRQQLEWIAKHTDLQVDINDLPSVSFVSRAILSAYIERVNGAYIRGLLVLRDDFAFSVFDISVLTHELTHHVQRQNGWVFTGLCDIEREMFAYELQRQWEREMHPMIVFSPLPTAAELRQRYGCS